MNEKLKRFKIVALVTGIIVALVEALFLEKYFFKVERFNIGRLNSNRRVRIILLTDLHFKKRFWSFHAKLANTINGLKPDLILISGDIIDETGTSATAATKFFNRLNRDVLKAAILGNHDHKNKVDIQTYMQMLEQNNCVLLTNKSKAFLIRGERIMVTGVDDFIEGEPCFSDAIKSVGKEKNHLLLVHSPKQLEKVKKELKVINKARNFDEQLNIQYAFAGHNHGGQVKILGFAPVMPEKSGKYISGWYNKKPPYLYVSNGFGTSTLPFRFGARSEVTVLEYGV